MSQTTKLFITVLLSCVGLAFFFPTAVFAQQTLNAPQPVSPTQPIEITQPIQLPNQTALFSGTGEPGAQVNLTAYRNQSILYTRQTTVNSAGAWQITMPAFAEPPTRILVTSQIELTLAKTVETTVVTTTAIVGSFVVLQLVLDRLFRFLQIAGLFGRRKTKGFVFDLVTKKPVAFALLTIESLANAGKANVEQLHETVVSSVDGFFKTVDLAAGTYQITVAHPDYTFPAQVTRPWYATQNDFYLGEPIHLGSQRELQIILIPLQPLSVKRVLITHWLNARVFLSVITQIAKYLSLPMGILSLAIVFFYPSLINFAISSLYVILAAVYIYEISRKKKLAGVIRATEDKPIAQAVVHIYRIDPDELAAVTLTDRSGHFHVRLPKGKYHILFSKDGFTPVENQGMSFDVIDLEKNQTSLSYTMNKAT